MPPTRALERSTCYAAANRFAQWWLRRYTRGVASLRAAGRSTELAFELWEHAAAAERDGWSGIRAAVSLVGRTVAGAPRDLRWRRIQDDAAPTVVVHLIGRRRRPRSWVPLQHGHVFDQTNGLAEPDTVPPPDAGPTALGRPRRLLGFSGD